MCACSYVVSVACKVLDLTITLSMLPGLENLSTGTSNPADRFRSDLRKIIDKEDQSVLAATKTIREYIDAAPRRDFFVLESKAGLMVYKIANRFPECLLDVDVRQWLGLPKLTAHAPSLHKALRGYVDKEPRALHDLPLHQYIELRTNAKTTCQGAVPDDTDTISPYFIDGVLSSTDNLVWLLLVGGVIHGYVVAEEIVSMEYRTLRVHLMCSDRGNGRKLFKRAVEYAQGSADWVEIEPLNDDLARLYAEWGEDFGLVFRTGLYGRMLRASVNGDDDDDDESDSMEYD